MDPLPYEETEAALGGALGMGAAAVAAAQENAQAAAKLLLQAIESLVGQGAEGAQEAAKQMIPILKGVAEDGQELGGQIVSQLKPLLGQIVAALSDIDVEAIQNAVVGAAEAGLAGFMELWRFLSAAVKTALEAGRALVEVAAPVIADGAQQLLSGATDIYNSPEVQDAITDFGEDLDDAYNMSLDEVRGALKSLMGFGAAGCVTACPALKGVCDDLLKLEIFRDAFQVLALFFSQIYKDAGPAVEDAKDWIGRIANLIALDFYAVIHSELFLQITIFVTIVLAVVMVLAMLWLIYEMWNDNPDELTEGHDVKTWKDRKIEAAKKVRAIGLILTLGTTIYLPVSRMALEVLVCEEKILDQLRLTKMPLLYTEGLTSDGHQLRNWTAADGTAYQGDCSGTIHAISWCMLGLITFLFPLACAHAIQKNKPRGSLENPDVTFDDDGTEVAFDNQRYLEQIQNDPNQLANPYRTLYKGFERKWAFYKVIQMVFKFLVVVPCLLLVSSPKNQVIAVLAVVVVYAAASFYSAPFIDPTNDMMDDTARVVAILSALIAVALAYKQNDENDELLGLLLNILMACNAVVMLSFTLSGLKPVKMFYQNMFGLITFHNSVLDTHGPGQKIIPKWDLMKEVKHRVWHKFWGGMLIKKCGDEVAERLLELKDQTRNFGLDKIKYHWAGEKIPAVAACRKTCISEYEGVDLYWESEGSDTKSCFGKCWVDQYPFHMYMVYDDCAADDDVTPIWNDDEVAEFVRLQQRDDVVAMREVRKTFRALAASKQTFDKPFTQMETERVEDGTTTTTDSEGQTHTEAVYSSVTFEVSYTKGAVVIHTTKGDAGETPGVMPAGFNLTMEYNDGCGTAIAPRTGRTYNYDSRSATQGEGWLGVNSQVRGGFAPNSETEAVFSSARGFWEPQLPLLLEEEAKYRQHLIAEHREANATLNDGFWYAVYNNANLTRSQLENYLAHSETNQVLVALPEKHAAGLSFLYKRLKFCHMHPCTALWFVFWDDYYEQNKDTNVMKAEGPNGRSVRDDIDPVKGWSIAYKPMRREKLTSWLKERGLHASCCGLFDKELLNALYKRMGNEQAKFRGASSQIALVISSAADS